MIIIVKKLDDGKFYFDYDIHFENDDETVHDVNLFIVTMLRDLVLYGIKLKDFATPLSYDFDVDDELRETLDKFLIHLAEVIDEEKQQFNDELNNLLN